MSTSASGPGGSANIPFAMLVGIGTLALFASGTVWIASIQSLSGGVALPWTALDPTKAAWIVVLFWIGILCLVGGLVAAAVEFSIEQALNRLPASAPAAAASSAPLVSNEGD